MANPSLILKRLDDKSNEVTPIDENKAESGAFHTFVAGAGTSETLFTMPTNAILHVKTLVITNKEAGATYFRLNDSADAQAFPEIRIAATTTIRVPKDELVGLTFSDDVKAQYAAAFANGFDVWIGGVLECTGAEAAE